VTPERRPAPGSAWARHCPDAWPREWLDHSGELPPGFLRAADRHEADLIAGRTTEPAFLLATGRAAPAATPSPRPQPGKGSNPVVEKVLGYRRFFEALAVRKKRLSPGAVALWCWLWTCERKGQARSTVRAIGERFGVSKSTAARWLVELRKAGFVRTVLRGRVGRSASVVRVFPSPGAPHRVRRGDRSTPKASGPGKRPTGGTLKSHGRDKNTVSTS
jgi:hypothetical protein